MKNPVGMNNAAPIPGSIPQDGGSVVAGRLG